MKTVIFDMKYRRSKNIWLDMSDQLAVLLNENKLGTYLHGETNQNCFHILIVLL